jgi:hypothetical protein
VRERATAVAERSRLGVAATRVLSGGGATVGAAALRRAEGAPKAGLNLGAAAVRGAPRGGAVARLALRAAATK